MNQSHKKRPWWRFWKTEEDREQGIIDMGYNWAVFQIVKEVAFDKIRNWSSFPDDSEFKVLVGMEKAIEEFESCDDN